jgi:NAD(P)-dependent dehydrogenase (short-subunit alcohol dehydrogenase family)
VTWDPRRLPSQVGKTFVVTGGNAGIGYFICEQLAEAGASVVIAARNEAKSDAAIAAIRARVPAADIRFVLLDLGSFASIRAAAGTLQQLDRIDGLIENAGAIMPSKSRLETVDGNEIMFGTNHLGHFLLTALLYPALQKTPGSRVVTMGSGSTRLTKIDLDNLQGTSNYSSWRSYGQSKHATQSFGFELDRRLRAAGSSVTSLVAHPGGAQDGNSPYREGVIEPSRRERIAAKLLFVLGGGKDAGAWPVVRAAIDPDASGGQYWGPHRGISGRPVIGKPSPASHGERLGRELWSRTEDFVGQRFEL